MDSPIYLDNNATTQPAPEVIAAMADCMTQAWANASSSHALGQIAKQALAAARAQVAKLLGCKPNEIVFTSGATEANHMALRGALAVKDRPRVVVSRIEHAGQMKLVRQLEAQGAKIDWMSVRKDGTLDLERALELLGPDVALVSVLAANNETGVLMPMAELAAAAKLHGALLHVDATQWIGKLPFDFAGVGVDLLSLSAHKFNGPKGVGALVVRQGLTWPALFAGTQERARRGGTENLPGIVGFAAAAARLTSAAEGIAQRAEHVRSLRDMLEQGLRARLPATEVFGAAAPRLPNTSYLRIGYLHADLVLNKLEQLGVIASSGSACASSGNEPSHVLLAMGVAREEALCAIRLTLSDATTEAEIRRVLERVPAVLAPLLHGEAALAN
jgi:cysteine desulfurase